MHRLLDYRHNIRKSHKDLQNAYARVVSERSAEIITEKVFNAVARSIETGEIRVCRAETHAYGKACGEGKGAQVDVTI